MSNHSNRGWRFLHALTWAVLASCTFGATARAAITLNGDFDHGSLLSYQVFGNASSPTVALVGRDNFYGSNRWRWMNFIATGVQGTTPLFNISQPFAGGQDKLASHPMVYSYDGENWSFFDRNELTRGNAFVFSNNAPFTEAQVQIAYGIPYSYGDSVAHTRQVLASPWAQPTASNLSLRRPGMIGVSPGGTDDVGRTVTPKDIYAYRITNPATDSPTQAKRKVVITTGMHPAETIGTHTFAGLVDWLISDDPRAANLRDVAEFYAYPTMNPDGRFAGNNRATVENPDRDPNGFWNPTRWIGHEDIQVNGEAMIRDVAATPGTVDAFIDFHSTWPSGEGDDFAFIEYEQGDNLADWWLNLKALQPNVVDTDSTGSSWTSANFAEAFLMAQVDVTFETMFGFERNLDYYRGLGENFGIAFYQAWAEPVPEPAALLGLSVVALLRRRRAA